MNVQVRNFTSLPALRFLGIYIYGNVQAILTYTVYRLYVSRLTSLPLGLCVGDYHEVWQSLRDLNRRQILDLGGALGLLLPTLNKMQTLPQNMVAAWLNREDNVLSKSGKPSWSNLVNALREIGQNGVAEDIKSKYISIVHSVSPAKVLSTTVATAGIEFSEDLSQRMHADVDRIKQRFALLQSRIRHSIKDHKELASHIGGMYILSSQHEEEVKQATSTGEIFEILRKYWSFLDYSILENITQNPVACDCSVDIQQEMDVYRDELKEFCKRRVSEIPSGSLVDRHDGMEKLVVILDLSDPSLQHIKYLKENIANILGIRASRLLLHDIQNGSVVVTFLLTSQLKEVLFERMLTEQQKTDLIKAKVIALKFR